MCLFAGKINSENTDLQEVTGTESDDDEDDDYQ